MQLQTLQGVKLCFVPLSVPLSVWTHTSTEYPSEQSKGRKRGKARFSIAKV